MSDRIAHVAHLAARFFGSLRAREPSSTDRAWVRTMLTAEEFGVWTQLTRADRVESIDTARQLVRALRDSPYAADPRWLACALLHDVGKRNAGLGAVGRALATARATVQPADRIAGRAGRYLRHAELGAAWLEAAGARREPARWAAVHHDPGRWPLDVIPAPVCDALARADGERVPPVEREVDSPR